MGRDGDRWIGFMHSDGVGEQRLNKRVLHCSSASATGTSSSATSPVTGRRS